MNESAIDLTESLLARTGAGDVGAMAELFNMYRARLRQMVRYRMDDRLVQRFDPSDVIQEALIAAAIRMPAYLRDRPVSFYPWLRRLTWERLVDLQREHLDAERRTVTREEPPRGELSGESLDELARSLAQKTNSGPLSAMLKQERMARLREALQRLDTAQREVLLLRYLEGLRLQEVAEVMGATLGATKMRHLRAIRQLRELLTSD